MLEEFKEFALKGNMVDLAIGIIIGGAFGGVVTSLVKDVIMPPIGALLGGVDFSNMFAVIEGAGTAADYGTLEAATSAGAVTLNYGLFINAFINFLIIAFVVYLLVKAMNKMRKEEEATTKECPFCKSEMALDASRCPSCTSEVAA